MTQTVLITGTSTGIGRATAERFHAADWNVAATMRDPGGAGDLDGRSGVLVAPLDVTDGASIRAAVDAAAEAFGGIDVLRYGVDTARRGWAAKADVVNALPWAKVEKARKRGAARSS